MKKLLIISWLFLVCCLGFIGEASAFSNQHQFTVPSRGARMYTVNVPNGAKRINVVISGQTEMVNLALYGPGKSTPVCKATTWSNLSNWRKPLRCSVGIVPKRQGQGPGVWRIKVEGSVHIGKADKIRTVSGLLKIDVTGVPASHASSSQKMMHASYPQIRNYQFSVPSRGAKFYEIRVLEGAKRISVAINGQTEMVSLALYGPGKNTPVCKTTTWSNLSNWRKALRCSAGIVPTRRGQGIGVWRVKVEGTVHKSKLDKVRSVSGHLTIRVD